MSRARENADGARLDAPLASPTFTGTTTVSGDLVPSTPLSHRNMIYNGGMQVWQYGGGGADATCDTTAWSGTVTMDSTTALREGMNVTGTGIPAGTTVASITSVTSSVTTFVLSQDATANGTNVTLTFTKTATSLFDTADRWRLYDPSSGSYTSEKHTMAVGELNTTGHRTALKLACTGVSSAGSGDHAYFYQPLEGRDCQKLQYGTANAKTVTISFWVKSTITGTYCFSMYTVGGTNYQVAKEYTISSADTWEYKTITITPTEGSTSVMTSSASLIANNNGGGCYMYFFLVSGSAIEGTADQWGAGGTRYATSNQVNWLSSTSNTFYITGIQMELGQNATPFEHRIYNDELARCQRYYFEAPQNGIDHDTLTYLPPIHQTGGTAYRRYFYYFPVEMRANPIVAGEGEYGISINNPANPVYAHLASDLGSSTGDWVNLYTITANAEIM